MNAIHPLFHNTIFALAIVAGLTLCPQAAQAAQSYDACTGFIDSLPATITKQGVWCLRKDLSTGMTSGSAITIANNNVTIDCHDFKLGGLQAGDGSAADGIRASNRTGVTVRHCNIRGFFRGIDLSGSGHLVENNRLDNNLHIGIRVNGGAGHLVRRNRVFATGGATGLSISYGIWAEADVTGNLIDTVFASGSNSTPVGIQIDGDDGFAVRDNIVRGLVPMGSGVAFGVIATGDGSRMVGNHLTLPVGTGTGTGITGPSGQLTVGMCAENTISGFAAAISNCFNGGNNHVL